MRSSSHTLRHRLASCFMLVALLSMFTHMAVPHHHHAHFVALLCMHGHHIGPAADAPHCHAGDADCQAEDAADWHPCDPLKDGALRPAQRHLHDAGPHAPHLIPTHWAFLPGGLLHALPAPLCCGQSGMWHDRCTHLPDSVYLFSFGLRAPPQYC